MTLYFSNPGDLDLRLLTTFGVNIKPGSTNPIGFFGTGMKYAIAGVLRLGGTVTIHTQDKEVTLSAKTETYRGKAVEMVHMDEQVLPFSTDLGKHWEPWMIYREFYCNAKDEGGGRPDKAYPHGAGVVFAITCLLVEAVSHDEFFLDSTPFAKFGSMHLHPGRSPWIYYKGIAVCKPSRKPMYIYNFTDSLQLTEDRTAGEGPIRDAMSRAFAMTEEAYSSYLSPVLTPEETDFEQNLNFIWTWQQSKTFKQVMARTVQQKPGSVTASSLSWAKANLQEDLPINTLKFTEEQEAILTEAKALLAHHFSLTWTWPLHLTEEKRDGTQGFAYGGAAYINPIAFECPKQLFSTLLEEHIHLAKGYDDCTRAFQEEMHKYIQALVFPQVSGTSLSSEVLHDDSIPF